VQLDGLQQVLGELLESSRQQQLAVAQLRADVDARFGAIERHIEVVDATLGARTEERELRRVETEAQTARDGLARALDELRSRFADAVKTIDERDSRRLLLLTEVHNEVKTCASAQQLQRAEKQVRASLRARRLPPQPNCSQCIHTPACFAFSRVTPTHDSPHPQLSERITHDQLRAARATLEAAQRAAHDAWQERADALSTMLGTAASTLAEHAQLLPRLATTEAVERTHRTFVAELAAIGALLGALRRDVAAERAAAEQTARLARDEGALRLVELSELAHAAAAIADEAHATAAKAVPRADVHSLEQLHSVRRPHPRRERPGRRRHGRCPWRQPDHRVHYRRSRHALLPRPAS
jgi:hypothetical protein